MVQIFDEQQLALRAEVRRLLTRRAGEGAVRTWMESTAGFDRELWQQMAQMGLLGLSVPEQQGGVGASLVETALVAIELGRALTVAPFLASAVLATGALMSVPDDPEASRLLDALVSGARVGTVADGGPVGTFVAEPGDESAWRIRGSASQVLDGMDADVVLVVAAVGDTAALFAVDPAGLEREAQATLDLTRRLARLDCAAAPARLLGEVGQGEAVRRRFRDLASTFLALDGVGGAERLVELAVDHAATRVQFGRPIGSFQAVQHACADMLLEVELARAAALGAVEPSEKSRELASSLAKTHCCNAYVEVADKAIQVFGGVGFTWEHPAHLYLKRAKSNQLLFGSGAEHRHRIGELIALT